MICFITMLKIYLPFPKINLFRNPSIFVIQYRVLKIRTHSCNHDEARPINVKPGKNSKFATNNMHLFSHTVWRGRLCIIHSCTYYMVSALPITELVILGLTYVLSCRTWHYSWLFTFCPVWLPEWIYIYIINSV